MPVPELPWLYGIARRTLANRRRGHLRRLRLVDRLAVQPSVCGSRTEREEVYIAFARLRPDDQEILRLASWEQLSGAEIALVLECTANAAALRLSRARQRFRTELTGILAGRTPQERKVTDA